MNHQKQNFIIISGKQATGKNQIVDVVKMAQPDWMLITYNDVFSIINQQRWPRLLIIDEVPSFEALLHITNGLRLQDICVLIITQLDVSDLEYDKERITIKKFIIEQ